MPQPVWRRGFLKISAIQVVVRHCWRPLLAARTLFNGRQFWADHYRSAAATTMLARQEHPQGAELQLAMGQLGGQLAKKTQTGAQKGDNNRNCVCKFSNTQFPTRANSARKVAASGRNKSAQGATEACLLNIITCSTWLSKCYEKVNRKSGPTSSLGIHTEGGGLRAIEARFFEAALLGVCVCLFSAGMQMSSAAAARHSRAEVPSWSGPL